MSTDFAPHNMTGNSSPSPYVASASTEFSSTFAAWKAFEGNPGFAAYWLGDNAGVDWLRIDLGSGNDQLLDNYSIQVNTIDEPLRAPKAWTMEGSPDGSSWTTLDTRTNQTSWAAGSIRNFTCATRTTAYRYFRVNISQNNGDATFTQIAELYLFSAPPFSPTAVVHYYRLAG